MNRKKTVFCLYLLSSLQWLTVRVFAPLLFSMINNPRKQKVPD